MRLPRFLAASLSALALLAGAAAAQIPGTQGTQPVLRNFKAGFTLSVDATTPNTVVDYGAGQASDSTNSILIASSASGSVNLGASGACNNLDTGTIAASTWYALYVLGPGCVVASAPAIISTTGAITASSATLGTASGTNITTGSLITVQGAGPASTNLNTTVTAETAVSVTPTGTTTDSSNSISSVSSIASVIPGLAISGTCIQAGTVITAASGSTISLSQNTAASGCGSGDTLTITGENVTLAAAAVTTVGETAGTTTNLTVPAWGVSSISGRTPMSPLLPSGYSYYRYIGSVLTNGSSHVTPFSQHGNEFVWLTPIEDVSGTTVPDAAPLLFTATVPLGVQVMARTDAGSSASAGWLLIQSPDETPQKSLLSNIADADNQSAAFYNSVSPTRSNTAGQLSVFAHGNPVYIWTRGWFEDWGVGN